MKTVFLLIAIMLLPALITGQSDKKSASELINTIIKETGSAPVANTVDVIKTGDPQTLVTGIVTTMFATMDVLRKAVEMKCNLIIVHEPLFYNHRDETAQFRNSPVFLEKKKYIDDNNLVIWRFHDYIHRINPDAINYGMTLKLGWEKYVTGINSDRYTIPETTLEDLLNYIKKIFPKNAFNVIGDPKMKITRVAFSAGAPGAAAHYKYLDDSSVELLIAGEVPQWETYEYVRDAVSQGRKKGIVFLGHITSEEPGMEYCATWLKRFIKDIPVTFVASEPSYRTF
jgi:putative NIF3 family GTP cyclohydrolase 1 type 2